MTFNRHYCDFCRSKDLINLYSKINLKYKHTVNNYKNIFSCDFFKPTLCENINHIFPEEITEYEKYFDVMFMLNSLEHLSSFSHDFNNLINSMKKSSLIIIETPNFDSIDSFIFKKYWGGLHQPRHTFLWEKKFLIKHLESWGYKSKSMGSPQSAHWAISIQNFFASKSEKFKNILENGRMPGYLVVVLLFIPVSLLQNLLGKESVLNIVSKR